MSTPSTVASAELNELLKRGSGPRMIDVRTPAEFETVPIPGAYNVPLDLLREHRDEIATHFDDDVVLVCRSGQRAIAAEEALRRAGLTNVRILDDGMTAWQSMGFETRRGTQRWDLESQVRLALFSLALGSVLRSVAAPKLKRMAASVGARLAAAALTKTPLLGSAACKAC
jgi:rhodanese-related sulfurtransferase